MTHMHGDHAGGLSHFEGVDILMSEIEAAADETVRLVPTPGHTKGHLSVVVEQPDHLVLLAGDATYSEAALEAGVVDGVAQDKRAHRRSTARLRELCGNHPTVVAPTHDPMTDKRLTEGATSPSAEARA